LIKLANGADVLVHEALFPAQIDGLQQLVHHQDVDIPVFRMPKRAWKTSDDFKAQ
jgi:hypothetical protein